MGLFRNESIERVVDMMGIALPDRIDSKLAKSAIPQARRRLAEDPLAHLFATTADAWATKSADAHRWRGLALYGMDGTTLRVPDSPENRATFGGTHTHRGGSGYPLSLETPGPDDHHEPLRVNLPPLGVIVLRRG